MIDTHIAGTLYLLHQVLPAMVAGNQGKVLVTGSVAGISRARSRRSTGARVIVVYRAADGAVSDIAGDAGLASNTAPRRPRRLPEPGARWVRCVGLSIPRNIRMFARPRIAKRAITARCGGMTRHV